MTSASGLRETRDVGGVRLVRVIAIRLIAAILGASGIAKLVAPASGTVLPFSATAAFGVVETVLAIALLVAPERRAVLTSVLAFSTLLLVGLIGASEAGIPATACGCFGKWLVLRGYAGHYALHGFILITTCFGLMKEDAVVAIDT